MACEMIERALLDKELQLKVLVEQSLLSAGAEPSFITLVMLISCALNLPFTSQMS
jgi:hypothetical protein